MTNPQQLVQKLMCLNPSAATRLRQSILKRAFEGNLDL